MFEVRLAASVADGMAVSPREERSAAFHAALCARVFARVVTVEVLPWQHRDPLARSRAACQHSVLLLAPHRVCARSVPERAGSGAPSDGDDLDLGDPRGCVESYRELVAVERPPLGNGQGIEKGQLNYPIGIAVMQSAPVFYVAEWGNHRVCEWDVVTGTFKKELHLPALRFPSGLCISPDDALLAVSDWGNHQVLILSTQEGSCLRSIQGVSPDLAVDNFLHPVCVCSMLPLKSSQHDIQNSKPH